MAVLKCKMCGGDLIITENMTVAECDSCGSKQTLPRLNDDKKASLYDRANHFRRNNDYDKAAAIFEQILEEDTSDAEAYWSLVLCRYGIEYVEDPATHKRVPTVNRAQYTSVFADENYKSALQYADAFQREIYEKEAKSIDEIQKGIIAISQTEEPFDVFICYKESDADGRRTQDSVLANDLYHQLTNEGFKVFFARITLEDKLGSAYEPYIFAALNSAKVMVVLGTKPEYFNAVWVKNEWSRYLALIRGGAKKMLIPAYKDMDPYDLPEEFSHLQAQNMANLGFMQDLIRGIKKIAGDSSSQPRVTVSKDTATTDSLLKRVFLFLGDGDFKSADEYCEKVLDIDPENAKAYVGKLLVDYKIKNEVQLGKLKEPIDKNKNYTKAVYYADSEYAEKLRNYAELANENYQHELMVKRQHEIVAQKKENDRIKQEELERQREYEAKRIREAAERERKLEAERRAEETRRKEQRQLELAVKEARRKSFMRKVYTVLFIAVAIASIVLWKMVISPTMAYNDACALLDDSNYKAAYDVFAELGTFKDSEIKITECSYNMARQNNDYPKLATMLSRMEKSEAAALYNEMLSNGYSPDISYDTIAVNSSMVYELKEDSTVVANGRNKFGNKKVNKWTDIVGLYATGYCVIGLRANGTLASAGRNDRGELDVENWSDIIDVVISGSHTVGLKSDGTVVATGYNGWGQCDVSGWTDIVQVAAENHTVGLRRDGTVVATGDNDAGQCSVSEWKNIVKINVSRSHTVGLKSNGTVVATGDNSYGQCDVSEWKDIIQIDTSLYHTVGLKADGTVVISGRNDNGRYDVSDWTDIVEIGIHNDSTNVYVLGLKSDGTVVITGDTSSGFVHDVSGWTDIVDISADGYWPVGLKSDGTAVCTYEEYGAEDVMLPYKP